MARTLLCRLGLIVFIVVTLAALAPGAAAQGPTPSGSYAITYYNYVAEEGGAACPSGGISGGTDAATGTFHFWAENSSPYSGVNANQYTVCWDGWITFPSAGSWFVQSINDDGMDIWVDGAITMRAWYDQGPTVHTGSFSVDPNVAHHVIIKYYNQTLAGTACVGWGPQGGALAYWNCPTAQTVTQAPVYAPPATPPYAPPYVPPYSVPCGIGPTYPGEASYAACGPQAYVPYPYGYTQYPLPPNYCIYVIRRGDTLSRIAARYGVSYWVLAYINGIANPSRIYAGTAIVVPNCR